jgi:serine/threonine-protein kinase RsbT
MVPQSLKSERLEIRSSEDVVLVRQKVRLRAVELGFSLVDQTRVVTAASELARNALIHGGGGWAVVETVERLGREGLKLTFQDEGPGIPEVAVAMQDGFTTGHGLGLGLGGAKRLSNEFEIESTPGQGTRVTITRWKG